jgi:hypothetical protein
MDPTADFDASEKKQNTWFCKDSTHDSYVVEL